MHPRTKFEIIISGKYMEIKEVDVESKIETNNPDSDTDHVPVFAD